MDKKYNELVIELRDSLTQDNWNKGQYFAAKGATICMCVHGAGQKLINPNVKNIFNNIEKTLSSWRCAVAAQAADNTVNCAANAAKDGEFKSRVKSVFSKTKDSNLLDIWNNRGDAYATQNHNAHAYNASLHFLMGMFGITASFNDKASTTLEMLKDKLTECAAWAKTHNI